MYSYFFIELYIVDYIKIMLQFYMLYIFSILQKFLYFREYRGIQNVCKILLQFLIFLLHCHVYLFFSDTNVELQSILACILIFHKIKKELYIHFFYHEDKNRMY